MTAREKFPKGCRVQGDAPEEEKEADGQAARQ
jgi:hypothetical protein